MARPFGGEIRLDVRDSTPDWSASLADRAPAGAPNVLVVLYDDTGQAAWSPYGGRISMPTMERLADVVVLPHPERRPSRVARELGHGHKDGRVTYAYNFLGIPPEKRISAPVPTAGPHVIGVEFTKARMGEYREGIGPLKLKVVFDIADDASIDLEAHLAAAMARD
jgi:hypothetical protein